MKTLLVPTNFSSISNDTLPYATALAKKLNAKITLLHAYHTFPSDPGFLIKKHKEEVELIRKKAEIKLKGLCEKVESTSSCKCEFINAEGLTKDIIAKYANETKPDLLIIGTENLIYIDRVLFGTVTGKVMEIVNCTLLIVPEDAPYKPPKKIAFAMDYHDSDIEEILFISKLAQKFKAEIHIIHVVSDDKDVKYEKSFFEDFKGEVKNAVHRKKIIFKLIKEENIITGLEEYVDKEAIDILALAKTGKTFMERLFIGSVSQKLFNHTHIPLLIFKAEDKPNDLF